jgi:hypothetical protein
MTCPFGISGVALVAASLLLMTFPLSEAVADHCFDSGNGTADGIGNPSENNGLANSGNGNGNGNSGNGNGNGNAGNFNGNGNSGNFNGNGNSGSFNGNFESRDGIGSAWNYPKGRWWENFSDCE